jgi:hypothetical protein
MGTGAGASIGRLFTTVLCATLASTACGSRAPLDDPNAGSAAGTSGGTGGAAGASVGAGGDAASGAGAGGSAGRASGAAGGASGATGGATGAAASGGAGAGLDAGAAGAPAADGGPDGGGDAGMAPTNHSAGCGMAAMSTDSMTKFTQKVIMVSGVDPAFVARFPVSGGAQFNWTHRNFYLRLPANYDPSVAYPVDMEGSGCAGGETTGSAGEYALPATVNQTAAIQIGLSYVTSPAATPSCTDWTYDYTNSPEPAYLHAVMAAVEASYCVDTSRIFINGYAESGALATLAGCTNPDEIRAYGVQIGGGLTLKHPACKPGPVAAMYVVGINDGGTPIGPLATPQDDSVGSVASRDELLHRNGCVAPDFQIVDTCPAIDPTSLALPCAAGVATGDTYGNAPHALWDPAYPKCHTYTGCPAKYPVVWCPLSVNHGNGPNPMGSDGGSTVENYRRTAMWKFFSTLPAP